MGVSSSLTTLTTLMAMVIRARPLLATVAMVAFSCVDCPGFLNRGFLDRASSGALLANSLEKDGIISGKEMGIVSMDTF